MADGGGWGEGPLEGGGTAGPRELGAQQSVEGQTAPRDQCLTQELTVPLPDGQVLMTLLTRWQGEGGAIMGQECPWARSHQSSGGPDPKALTRRL